MTAIKPAVWQTAKGYPASHCRNCTAGWVRTNIEGSVHIICLLDREPVLADMTNCDRFEKRQSTPAEEAVGRV